ncbi:sigma-70 family RNA polymerase sigma factor [Mucilaginibacter sabulilitoris]|uniref:Sigma-70 family RNA polymerase sigma factor n=1 Tax=Mucilaginibacter sabulilitoris TaxID=1173583 RepID=A0ABZ0TE37_9SPHI|nr:sigma-70 family RNA polymerase sigma factor [Mucilaginibacter sabulilitoris]WPU91243.1 sigma-70 family RNA polymerase sigma factor [Mucilaginibacter sabulilitoris]
MTRVSDIIISALSDEEIVARIVNGEQHLYENLMRKFNLRLYRISMAIVNDDKEAEDIMQIAYLNAYRQLSNFKHQSSFSTWLTRILINESLLHKKRKLRLQKALMENNYNDYHRQTPLDDLMNKELKNALQKAVSTLPEKYRMVFVMREVQGMSTTETMEVLNLGESNVKIRLTRAKEMLRTELNAYWKPTQLYEFNLVRCDVIVNHVMNVINTNAR